MEELQLENDTLRTLIDKQAKRLSMWETTSQSSYNALAQSFRTRTGALKQQLSDPSALAQAIATPPLQPHSPLTSAPSTVNNNNNMTNKDIYDKDNRNDSAARTSSPTHHQHLLTITSLESQLAAQAARLASLEEDKAQLGRVNEKNTQVIARYREQWEKLKAGARRKEVERREREKGNTRDAPTAKDNENDAEKKTANVQGNEDEGKEAEAEGESEPMTAAETASEAGRSHSRSRSRSHARHGADRDGDQAEQQEDLFGKA